MKVVALPMNIMEMLMDEDSEFETDDEDDDTVKMILKFGKGQELISAKSQSELSRMFASLHVSLYSTPPHYPSCFSTCSGVWKIYEAIEMIDNYFGNIAVLRSIYLGPPNLHVPTILIKALST